MNFKSFTKLFKNRFSTSNAAPQEYPLTMKYAHWGMAVGIIGGGITVQAAKYTPKENMDTKMFWMSLHKSFGVLMCAAIIPRVLFRNRASSLGQLPAKLAGNAFEQTASTVSHNMLYFMMVFMPVSGVLMGYFGGKGIPFFGWHIPGAKEPTPAIAKNAFWSHGWVGTFLEYLVPIHVGAVGYHAFVKNQAIMARMNPFK